MPAGSGVQTNELLGLLGDGTTTALADLYARHVSVVFNVALRVTGDRSAAEEVLQTVFLDIWHRPERYDPARGPVRGWLTTMAHHRGVDWVRQESARRGREQRSAGADAERGPSSGVEEAVVATMVSESVHVALAALCDEERIPICLAYFGGRSYRQVAQELGIAEGTIKSRIRRGLQHLGDALQPEAGGRKVRSTVDVASGCGSAARLAAGT